MSAEWRSNLGAFIGATERAMKAGVIAAAELYVGDVRPQLLEGYKTGDFVTGNAANSVQRGEPSVSGDGVEIPVGSTQVNPPYPMYWELGFMSAWTGKAERKEIWVPTMVQNRDKYVAACASEIRAVDSAL